MKLKLLISYFYVISLFLGQAQAEPQHFNDTVTIAQYEEDLTGDEFKELIELKGVLLANDSDFYRDLWIDITSKHNNSWKISYKSGYKPELEFITLPNNMNKVIYFSSKQDERFVNQTTFLHTISNNNIVEIELPDSYFMTGSLLDQFKVQLSIDAQLDPTVLPIKGKQGYKAFYNNDGSLQEPTKVSVKKDASYTPSYISTSKLFGLTGVQKVYEADTSKVIGKIETLWYFEDGKWIRIKEQLK